MRYFFVLVLLLNINQLYAQTLTVRDKSNNEPLEFSTITGSANSSVVTNARGEAELSSFSATEILEIRMIGYTSLRISFDDLVRLDFKVYMSPSIFSIEQVVVSATKWKQPTLEVPIKVRPIPTGLIAFRSPQTSADLLSITGDVFIQKSQQGGGSPMIRGFAANRLLIVVDGVRMNNAIFRGGNLQNVISIDPFTVENAEVLFGPGSVIYGSDAIGGAMNFYTLAPKYSQAEGSTFSGSASTRFSSANNEKTGHFHFNIGHQKWAMLTSISYNSFGDLVMGTTGPKEYLRDEYVERQGDTDIVVPNSNPRKQVPTEYEQVNFMQKISFKASSLWDFNYGLNYSETSNYDRYDRLVASSNGIPRSAQWYYGPQLWLMNNLKINSHKKTSAFDRITLTASHQLFEESRNSRGYNSNILQMRLEKVHAFSLNVDFNKAIDQKQTILYGVEAIHNLVNSEGVDKDILTGLKSLGPSRYPKSNWSSYAAYLTYQAKISDKVNFMVGTRYNHFLLNAEFDNTFYPFPFTNTSLSKGAITGSMGFNIKPTRQWHIKTIISTGFRAPNIDDVGKVFDSTPGRVVVPSPDLNAEYAVNAELGVTRLFADFLEVDFLTYYTWLDNAMVIRNTTLNGQDSIVYNGTMSRVQSVQNAAKARVWGIQADFEFKLYKGLELTSRFNYQKGEEELDDGSVSPLRHAAPWFGVTSLVYSQGKLRMGLFANFSGEVPFNKLAEEERGKPHIYAIDGSGNPYSPAWYALNINFNYSISKNFTVFTNFENITNQRYRTYSSGIVAPGLNFVVGGKASF